MLELARKAAEAFGPIHEIKLLGGFQNNVFLVTGTNGDYVLKLQPDSPNALNQLKAELDWMQYLGRAGLRVAACIQPLQGELPVKAEGHLAVAMEKLNGTSIDPGDSSVWNSDLFKRWGKVLGRMHTLGKDYKPVHSFPRWDEAEVFTNPPHLPAEVLNRWQEFQAELSSLSEDEGFGLLHNDFHHHNFLLQGDTLALFDFGDCEYSWYAYDIAICIYHAAQGIQLRQRQDFISEFAEAFLQGYLQENNLSEKWLARIPFFLDYRRLYSFVYIAANLDRSTLNSGQLKYLEKMEQDICQGIPFAKTL